MSITPRFFIIMAKSSAYAISVKLFLHFFFIITEDKIRAAQSNWQISAPGSDQVPVACKRHDIGNTANRPAQPLCRSSEHQKSV